MRYDRRDSYYCVVDSKGNIWDYAGGDKRVIIGIDNQQKNELLEEIQGLKDVLENWRPKMIEAGYIEEPKKPENLMEEQSRLISALSEKMDELSREIKALKGATYERPDKPRNGDGVGEKPDNTTVKRDRKTDGDTSAAE